MRKNILFRVISIICTLSFFVYSFFASVRFNSYASVDFGLYEDSVELAKYVFDNTLSEDVKKQFYTPISIHYVQYASIDLSAVVHDYQYFGYVTSAVPSSNRLTLHVVGGYRTDGVYTDLNGTISVYSDRILIMNSAWYFSGSYTRRCLSFSGPSNFFEDPLSSSSSCVAPYPDILSPNFSTQLYSGTLGDNIDSFISAYSSEPDPDQDIIDLTEITDILKDIDKRIKALPGQLKCNCESILTQINNNIIALPGAIGNLFNIDADNNFFTGVFGLMNNVVAGITVISNSIDSINVFLVDFFSVDDIHSDNLDDVITIVNTKFGFIRQFIDLGEHLLSIDYSEDVPSFPTIHYQGSDITFIDFSNFTDYVVYIRSFVGGIIFIVYIRRIRHKLPNVIRGDAAC